MDKTNALDINEDAQLNTEDPVVSDKTNALDTIEDASQLSLHQGHVMVTDEAVGRPIQETGASAKQSQNEEHPVVNKETNALEVTEDAEQLIHEAHKLLDVPIQEYATLTEQTNVAHKPLSVPIQETSTSTQQTAYHGKESHESVAKPVKETDAETQLEKAVKVHVLVRLLTSLDGESKHEEKKWVKLSHDLGPTETAEQLFEQIPWIWEICKDFLSKVKSPQVRVRIFNQKKPGLVCVLGFGNNEKVEKYVRLSVPPSKWTDSTWVSRKTTEKCFPVFGLTERFVREAEKKLNPTIPMKIKNRSHWVFENGLTIYDSQIRLERYSKSEKIQSKFCCCPKQPDNCSCGVHALMFLIFKKQGIPITPNCLKNEDPGAILYDLSSFLDGEMTTDTLIGKYYIPELGGETYYTYDEKNEELIPPSSKVHAYQSPEKLELFKDE